MTRPFLIVTLLLSHTFLPCHGNDEESFEDNNGCSYSKLAYVLLHFVKHKGYDRGYYKLVYGGAAAATGAVAVVVAPIALSAAGFTTAGVAAGSLAASSQAMLGQLAGGGFFATLQSIGASGLGLAAKVKIASATSAVAAYFLEVPSLATCLSKKGNKVEKSCEIETLEVTQIRRHKRSCKDV